jgi:hypothetical protein
LVANLLGTYLKFQKKSNSYNKNKEQEWPRPVKGLLTGYYGGKVQL